MRTLLALPQIVIERCIGCGDCVDLCHTAVLVLRKLKAAIARPDGCDYCTECEAVCPVRAITCPFEVVLGESVAAASFGPMVDDSPHGLRRMENANDQPYA